MLRHILGIVLLAAASGCVTQPTVDSVKRDDAFQTEQRSLLVGKWFGDAKTREGGRRLQITQRAADGTYKVTFRVYEPSGTVMEQTEVGFWGASGSVYFTITRGWLHGTRLSEADPTDASLDDAYQILELTQATFRYRALQSDNEYSLSRVPDSFDFPVQ